MSSVVRLDFHRYDERAGHKDATVAMVTKNSRFETKQKYLSPVHASLLPSFSFTVSPDESLLPSFKYTYSFLTNVCLMLRNRAGKSHRAIC
ncbi:uncharacterized protein LOC143234288 isoform X2 [Tachypleus tridentatus]|uniref:uncharacterized protein LOC143234288 isoform X2 n=1 Tax=Tachypleus tridentatus TaxID=6853 RepID=UPI003FD31A9F